MVDLGQAPNHIDNIDQEILDRVVPEEPRFPVSITLGQDCTYFVPTYHGSQITRQWYNGQTINNPDDIEEIMTMGTPVLREEIWP